ncbi:SMI1/KNR4 family protein [Bacillus pseudomycoides]|uniref:SMI1/KNR4 family protein n=1 Tax=Bacillus pseudomycoides TaxID=64104 RepID=UPI000BF0A9D3|nr:SMI1/KNR4 family protein [Bacillus pseudomycoides]PEI85225.1 SMI1/KNR4 family protein [Bacillus pseudomycoides]
MRRIKWERTHDPITEQIISEVEEKFNVIFPQDYKNCVMKYNGGHPVPNIFLFEDGGEGVFDCLLSYTNEYISITVTYDIISPYIPKGIIPFATDPFGNKICFDFRNDKHSPTIVFYDSDECDEQAIEYICNTFTNLIDSLHFSENE